MQSLVSIIIPTYNRAEYIGETLDTILNQTYINWECIVVDDGSTDNTAKLMEFFCEKNPQIQYFHRPPMRIKGANACRNYGFELSKGEYINWFDSDDLMHPDFLKKKVHLLNNTNGNCCISQIQIFSVKDGSKINGKITTVIYENLLEELLLDQIAIPTPNPLWRRSFLLDYKRFDEQLQQSQDLDFHSRIFSKNDTIETINEILLYMRTGHNSISNDFYPNLPNSLDSYLKVREKILSFSKDNFKINKIIINQILGLFRYLLSIKKYKECEFLLNFIHIHSLNKSTQFRIALIRLWIVYYIFKTIGRGETRFKRTLYLP